MPRKQDKLGYSGNYKVNYQVLSDSMKGDSKIHISKKQLILSLGNMEILKEVFRKLLLQMILHKNIFVLSIEI